MAPVKPFFLWTQVPNLLSVAAPQHGALLVSEHPAKAQHGLVSCLGPPSYLNHGPGNQMWL